MSTPSTANSKTAAAESSPAGGQGQGRKLSTSVTLPPITNIHLSPLEQLKKTSVKQKKERNYKSNEDYFSDEEYDADGKKRDISITSAASQSKEFSGAGTGGDKYHDEYDELHAQAEKNIKVKKPEIIATLSVAEFKGMWSRLDIANTMQKKAEKMPSLTQLTEHFKKQNFHVVFANSTDNSIGREKNIEIEIGLCNTRQQEDEIWFLAKFLVLEKELSIVMKCQNPALLPQFIKRFELSSIVQLTESASKYAINKF